MSRTKIVATYGPACESERTFRAMLRAGLDVVRLNVSHLEPELLAETTSRLRKIAESENHPLTVMADMPGPKIRCTNCEPREFELREGDRLDVAAGKSESTIERLVVNYPYLMEDVKKGHEMAVNDGLVLLRVEEVDKKAAVLRCSVLRGGEISSRKGVCFLHSKLRISGLTPRDRKGIRAAAEAGADFIALSFVRTADDIEAARRILKKTNRPDVPLIAKIEHHEAIDNIFTILQAADGLMVARGDMGIERPLEEVPLLQKDIILSCNRAGKFVITATQMLESMITCSRPTRAEVTDVANAILDGTDAVMLSAETAMGRAPARVISTMTRIAETAETRIDPGQWLRKLFSADSTQAPGPLAPKGIYPDLDAALARAACHLVLDGRLDAIVCLSFFGTTARRIARYRPRCPVYVLSPHENQCRRLSLTWGVRSFVFSQAKPKPNGKTPLPDKLIAPAVEFLRERGELKKNQRVVFLSGTPLETPGGTNYLRVVEV